MMTAYTRDCLNKAVDELKRNGYKIILIMFDSKSDESKPLGEAMEVLCSETNDPKAVAAIARSALRELSVGQDARKDLAIN